MKPQKADDGLRELDGAQSVRASISFPAGLYETLEGIAKEKKVSLAWVVRDAAERYVSDRWPLFSNPGA